MKKILIPQDRDSEEVFASATGQTLGKLLVKAGRSPAWTMEMHGWLLGTYLVPQEDLHSGNCLKWSNWEKLGIFSIPSGCFLAMLIMFSPRPSTS